MPLLELMTSSGLGSLLGMRHALEPDHLAAVTTLVSRERSGVRAALLGMCWGLGHTLTLVAVGVVLIVLRAEMPASVSDLFELAVSLMLIGLGARAILQAAREGPNGPTRLHRHGRLLHSHAAAAPHLHLGTWTLARRPLLIGMLHGLAGSGALTALVLATLPTTTARVAYMALFGLGSTIGMAALSGLLGWPLARLGTHHAVARGVTLLVGCTSTALGLAWAYPLIGKLVTW
jgi:high-affinity nickel-transport protein